MDTMIIMSSSGEAILEKYSGFLGRKRSKMLVEVFGGELRRCQAEKETPLPVMPTPNLKPEIHSIFNVKENGLYLVCSVSKEISPLLLIEAMCQIWDMLKRYLPVITEEAVLGNFLVVQHLLEEMIDAGKPFTTEPNVLTGLIRPPDFLSKLKSQLWGSTFSDELPPCYMTAIPWRQKNAKHVSQEFLLNVSEELDCILDQHGRVLSCGITGVVTAHCSLNGMPDISLSFNRSEMFLDVGLHKCVRYRYFEREKRLSFVPPEGDFELMTYKIKGNLIAPIWIKSTIKPPHFAVAVGPVTPKPVSNIVISIPWSASESIYCLTPGHGTIEYDAEAKVCKWRVGNFDSSSKSVTLTGVIPQDPKGITVPNPSSVLQISFTSKHLLSGLEVAALDMHNTTGKPFKGIKMDSRAGNFSAYCS